MKTKLTRRGFLQFAGASTGLASIELTGCLPSEDDGTSALIQSRNPDFTVDVLRPRDMVVLRFEFVGLKLNAAKDQLEPSGGGERLIIVSHASQHIQEQPFLEASPAGAYHPVGALLSGPSRVVFRVPAGFSSRTYSLSSLLGWLEELDMKVGLNATPPEPTRVILPVNAFPNFGNLVQNPVASAQSQIGAISQARRQRQGDRALARALGVAPSDVSDVIIAPPNIPLPIKPGRPLRPGSDETSIELPFRLEISPNVHGAWTHAEGEVEYGKRVELWHSRLAVRNAADHSIDEASAAQRKIRALWTRDDGFNRNNTNIVTTEPMEPAALLGADRIQLVHNTSNFNPPGKPNYKPLPVDVNRMMLTGLGAWFDVEGQWKTPVVNLEAWEHRATQGRDHYVKCVYQGYLYPWGHRASLVVVTERKFLQTADPDDRNVAYLWQRLYVIVREPLKTFGNIPQTRQVPFLKLAIKQLVTPICGLRRAKSPTRATEPRHFCCRSASTPITKLSVFRSSAPTAAAGFPRFNGAAVWVPSKSGVADKPPGAPGYKVPSAEVDYAVDGILDQAAELFAGVADTKLNGQRVAFATPDQIDDTTYEVDTITFSHVVDGSGNKSPGYAPALTKSALRVEALRRLAGTTAPTEFRYADAYLAKGFGDGNQGALLFQLFTDGATLPLSFKKKSGDTGGFIAPSLDISALSRRVGPVAGDPSLLATDSLSLSEIFNSVDALLLGVFKLGDVLDAVGLDEAPKFVTQELDAIEDFMSSIDKVKSAVDLYASITANDLGGAVDTIDTLVPTILEAINAAVAGQDFGPLIGLIGDLDTALGNAKTALTGSVPTAASGVHAQALKLIDQVRSVIATNLTLPLQAFAKAAELAKNLTVRLEWRPPIKGFAGIFEPKDTRGLLLAVEARAKDLPGKPAGVDLVASLEKFDINLIGAARFMVLEFDRIQFKVTSNKKPEVDVVFKGLRFDGPLSFVEKLRQIIPIDGFSDPPNVDVSTEGISANFTLPLPNIAVGMFSLENLSLSAGFNIPFVGPPVSVNFAFCTRDEPFRLTVSMLGGGGFFGITVSPKEIMILEAALEFGAALSIDLGVASGSVSIMAGIYFRMELGEASLTGYLRIRGEMDVMGLISASIELYMELEYEFSSHKVTGRASIEIEISVLCFSGSVTVEAERKFAGSNEDPTFDDLMKPDGDYRPWDDYRMAFAA